MQRSKHLASDKGFSPRYIILFSSLFVLFISFVFLNMKFEDRILRDSKDKNIHLYVKYLESLARDKPEEGKLEELIKYMVEQGNFEKAISYIKILETYNKEKATIYKYEIAKRSFLIDFSELIKDICKLIKNPDFLKKIYRESIISDNFNVCISEKLYELTGEVVWIEKALKYLLLSKEYEKVLHLFKKSNKKTPKMFNYAFISAKELGNYKEAKEILKEMLDRYKNLRMKYIDTIIWLCDKTAENPMPLLLYYIKDSKGKNKKLLIEKVINISMWRKEYEETKRLIKLFINDFPEDKEFNTFLVKSAMATGDPIFAGYVAEKVARSSGVLGSN